MMFEEPIRQPAGYPIRIGFETYSLYNASRCFISPLHHLHSGHHGAYSVILSNISLSTPVACNHPLHPSDGNAYLDVYVISEVCHIHYFIGRTVSRLDTPILHTSSNLNVTLCGHTSPLVFKIPDYLLPSGCYIFIVSRRDNRCFRTVNPIPWYVPITNSFGLQSPTPHPRFMNSPQVTDHCRELHTSLHTSLHSSLHSLRDDEEEKCKLVEIGDKLMPSIVDTIGVHHTDGRYIPPEQYEYDKKVHKFFFHLFRVHYTRKRTDPQITDFLKTWDHLETRMFYKTMTSPDKFVMYIEKKYLSFQSGRLIHPFMNSASDILWRPAIIVIFDNVLSAKFESATQTRFSEDTFFKTFFDTSSFEPGNYIPSTASCVIFDTISKTTISNRTVYIIKIFRRLTTYDENEDPVKHILDTLHNSIN